MTAASPARSARFATLARIAARSTSAANGGMGSSLSGPNCADRVREVIDDRAGGERRRRLARGGQPGQAVQERTCGAGVEGAEPAGEHGGADAGEDITA